MSYDNHPHYPLELVEWANAHRENILSQYGLYNKIEFTYAFDNMKRIKVLVRGINDRDKKLRHFLAKHRNGSKNRTCTATFAELDEINYRLEEESGIIRALE